VGRGVHKSWCVLMSGNPTEEARQRLRVLVRRVTACRGVGGLEAAGPRRLFRLPAARSAGDGTSPSSPAAWTTLKEARGGRQGRDPGRPALGGEALAPLREHIRHLFA
jgi:hypothetical protein